MKSNYTIFIEDSVKKDFEQSFDRDSVENAADFLRASENFRPFNSGLIELLSRQGKIKNDAEASEYLITALRAIGSKINSKTVRSWLAGDHRPKIEPHSRRAMYEICFALGLSIKDVQWFFHHVYFDRAFNCHSISEVVFYFSFIHGLSYAEACRIIDEVNAAPNPVENSSSTDGQVYTQIVKNQVSQLETLDELKNFLIQNKNLFRSWNNTALEYIKKFWAEIVGDEETVRPLVQKIKRIIGDRKDGEINLNVTDVNKFGLLMREILFDSQNDQKPCQYSVEELIWRIGGKNIFSRTFVLDNLLTTFKGVERKIELPYVIKNNFPSKKILSDVLDTNQATTSESYDAIRKTLVLLHFYVFWSKAKFGEIIVPPDKKTEAYLDETDVLLDECGYESLYAGNPYDWIFLSSANRKEPLSFFLGMVSELLYNDE